MGDGRHNLLSVGAQNGSCRGFIAMRFPQRGLQLGSGRTLMTEVPAHAGSNTHQSQAAALSTDEASHQRSVAHCEGVPGSAVQCAAYQSSCMGAAAAAEGAAGPSSCSARPRSSTLRSSAVNCCFRSCSNRAATRSDVSALAASHTPMKRRTSTVAAVLALACSSAAMSCFMAAMAASVAERLGCTRHCFRNTWCVRARVSVLVRGGVQAATAKRASYSSRCLRSVRAASSSTCSRSMSVCAWKCNGAWRQGQPAQLQHAVPTRLPHLRLQLCQQLRVVLLLPLVGAAHGGGA
jgi:hypothetical protein